MTRPSNKKMKEGFFEDFQKKLCYLLNTASNGNSVLTNELKQKRKVEKKESLRSENQKESFFEENPMRNSAMSEDFSNQRQVKKPNIENPQISSEFSNIQPLSNNSQPLSNNSQPLTEVNSTGATFSYFGKFPNLFKRNGFENLASFSNSKVSPTRSESGTKGLGTRNSSDGRNSTGNRNSRFESTKQQVVSITYEEIGLFPRSFNRVFDRFFKQLFFDVENLVIQEYRFYRYLFLTTVKCVLILLFVPLSMNFLAKHYLVRPITEYYWNSHQPQIFLNSFQQKKAFAELQDFEEKIYFETLVLPGRTQKNLSSQPFSKTNRIQKSTTADLAFSEEQSFVSMGDSHSKLLSTAILPVSAPFSGSDDSKKNNELFSESVQTLLHEKILELAIHYNEESIEAITNFFADCLSFASLCYLFFALEIQINITKSFLLEVFFGLDDSKKSLFLLFLTDLLVGYHSPNIWELFFSSFFDHYGLPESQTTIFLLVATLPVLLDVLFKYLIFRHLNRASPATVATYHAMIE